MAAQPSKEEQANTSVQIIRPLGGVEKLLSALHVTRQYCAVVVICRYELPKDVLRETSAETVHAMLQKAIARTVLANPLLQVVQHKEDSASPAWRQLPELDLGQHIHWHPISTQDDYESELKKTAIKIMDTWYTDAESIPGWDVRVFHRTDDFGAIDVMFSWNHALADGISGKLFHEQVLRHLNEPESAYKPQFSSSNPYLLTLPDLTKTFPPPQEELIKYTLSAKYTVSTLWQELKPAFLAGGSGHLAHWCPIREQPMESAYQTIDIDASALRKLLRLCRQHETSLTGLIHALIATSLSLQLSGKNGHSPEPESFKACTPIDHRRYITSAPAGLPDFDANSTIMNTFTTMWHDVGPAVVESMRKKGLQAPYSSPLEVIKAVENEVWVVAATIRREIQQRVDKGPKDDLIGLVKFIKDWRSQHRDNARKPRIGSWLVTNLGFLDGERSGPWNITRSSFLNPSEMCSAAFCITAISVKGGSLTLGVCRQKCVVEASVAEQLVSNLQTWLSYLSADTC